MVDYSGLENRRAERHRGFESLSLRKALKLSHSNKGSKSKKHRKSKDYGAFYIYTQILKQSKVFTSNTP